MTLIIYVCGFYCLTFALFHIGFWKRFKWNKELKKMLYVNRGVMQILNVQIIYYFLAVAFFCFAFSADLLNTKLGNAFLLSCSLFWLIRTVQQFIFLDAMKVKKEMEEHNAKGNHNFIHILTVVFIIGIVLFALPVILK